MFGRKPYGIEKLNAEPSTLQFFQEPSEELVQARIDGAVQLNKQVFILLCYDFYLKKLEILFYF